MKRKSVYVQSFGCRASQADGVAIETSLQADGFVRVNEPVGADLIVVNTCTVTNSADVDARRVVRGFHRTNPDAEILVTGCYAQRAPAELLPIEGVRWVVGNSHKSEIADIVRPSLAEDYAEHYHGRVWVSDIGAQHDFRATPVHNVQENRTRPNLKIQDGCSNRCSFCVIPAVRGKSRSANLEDVISQVRELGERYCEVILTGINLGRWGRDLAERRRFPDLLRQLLSRTDVRRIRISSVEPMDWSDDLLELIAAEDRIARHVHAPLQSGSDSVLKRMHRKYRSRHYATRLDLVGQLMPDAAIGADVMTGFPGESEAEFQETVRFVEEQPFTYLHVFSYSERPGTKATDLPDQVPVSLRRERTAILRDLSFRKHLEFRRRMIGKKLSAVTLEQPGMALSSNFLKIELSYPREPNQIVDLQIGSLGGETLREAALLPVL